MAGSVNKVIIIGRVARDAEIRSTQSGERIATLSVATNETWRDKASGERREKSEFHRIVVFNDRLVEVIEKYVRKGMLLALDGQLQTRKWQDQSGQDRYSTEIVLSKFRGELTMLDSPRERESEPEQRPGPAPRGTYDDDLSDSIPF